MSALSQRRGDILYRSQLSLTGRKEHSTDAVQRAELDPVR